ncbi:AAA family ATPase [Egicoccus sp. AB-alg6-2]|uniref:ATP-binding protein n=1 Tax=Egicoccus sp. AB-alg6-2 TaxID=3242692 RepID=UPI00359E4305
MGAKRSPTSERLRFDLVGPFTVSRGGRRLPLRDLGSRKERTLLQVLLLHPDEVVSLDRIEDILWNGAPPATAKRTVASLVSRLRARLGSDLLEGAAGGYRLLMHPSLETDLCEAQRLTRVAVARLDAREPSLALSAATRALELVGSGALLADETDAPWVEPHRAALLTLRRTLRRVGWDAALLLRDHEVALQLAEAACADDPLDEEATRAVMRAAQLRGQPPVGLVAFDRLRRALAEQLGTDPSVQTLRVHTALLREESPDPVPAFGRPSVSPGEPAAGEFVGRAAELRELERRWSEAAGGRGGMVLLVGEAGVGKTRLALQLLTSAEATGGTVARVRCYEAERSLLLAPIVEVVHELVRQTPPARVRESAGAWAAALAALSPELEELLGTPARERADPEVARQRTFQAITFLVGQLAAQRPVVVFVDDLHHAGAATVELLHYIHRHTSDHRLLVLATVRAEEGRSVLADLGSTAQVLDVGRLSDRAVAALVERAGAERFLPRILALTRGHALSVVESLRALAEAGPDVAEPPVPSSLRAAVLRRVERAGPDVEHLLRTAAVLGATFDLETLAALLGLAPDAAAQRVEQAMSAGLVVEEGPRFGFSNDLTREIVYQDTPAAVRRLRHQRAAELLIGQPEAAANHAAAVGDWAAAHVAWLTAADRAAERYANRDAEELLHRAIVAGEAAADPVGIARARLGRARVREALADYQGAFEDLETAAELARGSARPELEAAALRALGGDVIVGLGRPSSDCLPYLEVGLAVAESAALGPLEVDLMGRIAVVWTNRTRFDLAAEMAERALRRARAIEDARTTAVALDAVKNVGAYTGDVARLRRVLPELEALLHETGDLTLLQWCVFESVIPPLAAANWGEADLVLARALALNRRTGHPWGSLFLAQRSWLHRARGHYGAAVDDAGSAGRAAIAGHHPWWTAFSHAMLGWVLSDAGAHEAAIATLEAGLAAVERDGMDSYLLRCVSHLALACWRAGDVCTADRHLARAARLLDQVRTPPGTAFLHAAHAYGAVARLLIAKGALAEALELLDRLRPAAERSGWVEVVASDRLLRGRARLLDGDARAARRCLDEGVRLAEQASLRPLAWEFHEALAHLERHEGDHQRTTGEEAAATVHLEVVAASIPDAGLRAGLLAVAARRRTEPSGEPAG